MNAIDKLIGWASPARGLQRIRARKAMAMVRDYDAAAHGRRTDGWRARGSSADAELAAALPILRNRHRELVRNNPWAKRAVEVVTNNTVGYGITGELTNSPVAAERWERWSSTTECDADGRHDLYGLQALVLRTVVDSGECLIRRRRRQLSDGLAVPLQLQVLEPDHLDHSMTTSTANGNQIIQGVEFDALGRRVAYWLYKAHPGGVLGTAAAPVRVPAEDVAHVYRMDRPGQVRGVPWGTAVMLTLRDLDDYEDAYLLRNKLANCLMAFLTDAEGDPQLGGGSPIPDMLEPGAIASVPAGKDVRFSDPPKPEGYGPYTKEVLHRVAAGYGITYQALTGNLESVNFSSGRMGWLEMHRNIEVWRWHMLIPQLCHTVAGWWGGAWELQGGAPGLDFAWTPPRREMIDPTKEVPSMIRAIRGGLTSLSETHRTLGYNSRRVLTELADDLKLVDELKLVIDSDARKVSNGGVTQARPDGTTLPSPTIKESEEADEEGTED